MPKIFLRPLPLNGWSPLLAASFLSCHNTALGFPRSSPGTFSLSIFKDGCLHSPALRTARWTFSSMSKHGFIYPQKTFSENHTTMCVVLNHGTARGGSSKLYLHCCYPLWCRKAQPDSWLRHWFFLGISPCFQIFPKSQPVSLATV